MERLDAQDVNDVATAIERLQRASGGIGEYISATDKSYRERERAEDRLRGDLGSKMRKTGEAFNELTGSAYDASQHFKGLLLKAGIAGAVIAKLIDVGNDWTKHYRELVNVGQSFNGSLLEMSQMAAASGLPLDKFTETVVKSSKVVAQMGVRDFGKFRSGMNKVMLQNAMYGMTTEQSSEFIEENSENWRKSGILTRMTDQQRVKSMIGLMEVTSNLASVTGVARDQINQFANAALEASVANARLKAMDTASSVSSNEKLQRSLAIAASQAGDAGKFFSGAMANTYGLGGSQFTDQGKTLIDQGLSNVAGLLNTWANNMSDSNAVEVMNQFQRDVGNQYEEFRARAAGGDAKAIELLKVYEESKKLTIADIKKRRKNAEEADGVTSLFLSATQMWNELTTNFKSGLFAGFTPIFKQAGDFAKSDAFQRIIKVVKRVGEILGGLIGGLFTKMGAWVTWFENIDWQKNFTAFFDYMKTVPWLDIGIAVITAATGFALLVKWLAPIISGMASYSSTITGLIVASSFLFGPIRVATGLFKGIWWAGSKVVQLFGFLKNPLTGLTGIFQKLIAAGTGLLRFFGLAGGSAAAAGGAGAGIAGMLSTVLLPLAGIIGGTLGLIDGASRVNDGDSTVNKVAGYGESALSGAIIGAGIGGLGFGVGAIPGAAIGAAGGLAVAAISDYFNTDKSKNEINQSQTNLEETAKKKTTTGEPNPVIARLDQLIRVSQETNDLMVSTSASLKYSMDEQKSILSKIKDKP